MTGRRQSNRLQALLKPSMSTDSEPVDPDNSDHGGDKYEVIIGGSNARPSKRTIEAADKDENDDEVQLRLNQPDGQNEWMPASAVPLSAVKDWVQGHRRFSKSIGEKPPPAIDDLIRGENDEIIVSFREGGKDKYGQRWPATEVPATAVPIDLLKEFVDKHKVFLRPGQDSGGKDIITLSPAAWEILYGEDIPPVRPDSESPPPPPPTSSSADRGHGYMLASKNNAASSKPHHPISATIKGECDDATKPLENVTHNDDVAPCQSAKHSISNPHYVCTGCHHKNPAYNLTRYQRDHIIRDGGLFPLCTKCVDAILKHWNIEFEEGDELDNCTCSIGLPKWLCANCWVDLARLRCNKREEDDRCRCNGWAGKKGNSGWYETSKTVRQCSGCDELVVKKW